MKNSERCCGKLREENENEGQCTRFYVEGVKQHLVVTYALQNELREMNFREREFDENFIQKFPFDETFFF